MLTVPLSSALRQDARWVLYAVCLLDAGLGPASPSRPLSSVLAAGVLPWLCILVGQVNYPKVADSSSFDEDSSDALSPEQPASHESQGSVPSPLESRVSDPLPSATSISPTQVRLPPSRFFHSCQCCPESGLCPGQDGQFLLYA